MADNKVSINIKVNMDSSDVKSGLQESTLSFDKFENTIKKSLDSVSSNFSKYTDDSTKNLQDMLNSIFDDIKKNIDDIKSSKFLSKDQFDEIEAYRDMLNDVVDIVKKGMMPEVQADDTIKNLRTITEYLGYIEKFNDKLKVTSKVEELTSKGVTGFEKIKELISDTTEASVSLDKSFEKNSETIEKENEAARKYMDTFTNGWESGFEKSFKSLEKNQDDALEKWVKGLDEHKTTFQETLDAEAAMVKDAKASINDNSWGSLIDSNVGDNVSFDVPGFGDNSSDNNYNVVRTFADEFKDTLGDISKYTSGIVDDFNAVSAISKTIEITSKIIKAYFEEWNNSFDKVVDSSKSIAVTLGEKLKESLLSIVDLSEKIASGIASGFGAAVEDIEQLVSALGDASVKMKELADAGVDLNNKYFKLSRILGSDKISDGTSVLGSLAAMYGLDADNLIDGFSSIESMLTKIGLASKDTAASVSKMALDLSAASGEDFGAISNKLMSAVTMGYVGNNNIISRLLFNTEAEKKAFKSLNTEVERANFIFSRMNRVQGAMSDYMNTAQGRIRAMNEALSSLKGNVSRLSMGLLQTLAPVLTRIIKLVDYVIQRLTTLFKLDIAAYSTAGGYGGLAGDGGYTSDDNSNKKKDKDNSSKKKDEASKKNKELAKSIKEVNDAAKEASRSVASFDDVIQLPENNDTLMDSLDDLDDIDSDLLDNIDDIEDLVDALDEISEIPLFNGGFNFGDLIPDNVDEKFEKIKDALSSIFDLMEKGQFFAAGSKLNKLLQGLLDDVPWDKIKDKVRSVAADLSQFLNGFFGDEALGYKLGNFLAQTINTAFEFLYTFLKNTNFGEIGEFLAEEFIGFWENIDSAKIGDSIAAAITDAFKFVKGFVDDLLAEKIFNDVPREIDTGFELIGYKIADGINHMFDGVDSDEIVSTITKLIDGIISLFSTLFETLDQEGIGDKLWGVIDGILGYVVDNFDSWLSSIVTDLSSKINGLFSRLDGNKLGAGIGTLISSIINNVGNLLKSIDFNEIGSTIGKTIQGILKSIDPVQLADDIFMLLDAIFDTVGAIFEEVDTQELIEKFGVFLDRLFGDIVANSDEWAADIKPLTDLIIGLIDKFFESFDSSHLLAAIQTFLDESGIFDLISRWAEAEFQIAVEKFFIKLPGVLEKFGPVITTVIGGLVGLLFGPLGALIGAALGLITGTVIKYKDDIAAWLVEAGKFIGGYFVSLWEDIKSIGASIREAIDTFIENIFDGIKSLFTDADDEVDKDSKESGENMVKSVKGSIGDVFMKWLNDHGFNIGEKIDKIVKSAKEKIAAVGSWFKEKLDAFKDFVGGIRDGIDDTVESIVDLFKDMWDALCDFLNPEKIAAKGREFIGGFLDGVAEAWQAVKDFFSSLKLPEIHISAPSVSSPSVKVNVPKMATGGIVTSSTFAQIGEAGREAVLPLDSNTAWMDGLAEKISSRMISNSSTDSNTVNIDISSINKDIYTRSEMLEFGRQVIEALKLCGFNVAVY